MRINIAASHRFHLLDLARELDKLGHNVRFYSYVPTKRALTFGLRKECSSSLYYLMLPFLAFVKYSKRADWSTILINWILDCYLSLFMRPCDLYIALGTVYKYSFVSAKKRFGATTILEWGSKHILEQQKILTKLPGVKRQALYFTQRSLDGYVISDYIAIPSEHVKQSFIKRGVNKVKLLQNPYGVDLSMFKPTILRTDNKDAYDLIMVGGWSYRKGCDLLIEVCRKFQFRLLHVGSIVDLPFPNNENMTHINAVNQKLLVSYYSMAKVFVLPSREDGFGMVLSQAVLCGLPIVCSKDTGGKDLQNFLNDKKWIISMKKHSVDELKNCIHEALNLARTQKGVRSYSNNDAVKLTWEAYGIRYNNNIQSLFHKN